MKLAEVYKRLKSEIGDSEFKIAEVRIFIDGYAQNFRYFESMFDKKVDLILEEEHNVIKRTKNGGIFNPWNFCDIIGRSKEDILYEERDSFKKIISKSVHRMQTTCDNINPETWVRFIEHLNFIFRKWD